MATADLTGDIAHSARASGAWLIAEGVLLVVLGLVAAALPAVAGVAAALVFGWALILSGVLGVVGLFVSRRHAHPVWRGLIALAALAAGALVLFAPLAGVISLAMLIAAYLIVHAVGSFALALDPRRRAGRAWIWLVLSGALGIVLAGFIILLRPLGEAVLVGLVVAINLLFAGVSLAGLGVSLRQFARASQGGAAKAI